MFHIKMTLKDAVAPLLTPGKRLSAYPTRRAAIPRRSKSLAHVEGLTIDTDVWEQSDCSSGASTTSLSSLDSETSQSPSPPASVPTQADQIPDVTAHLARISGWLRDAPLPDGPQGNLDAASIEQLPNGARMATNPEGRKVLLIANPAEVHSSQGLKDLLLHGMTRYTTRLCQSGPGGKLVRTRMGGKKVALRSGTYAFVIDQDGELLLSLTASAQEGAPAGAHMSLTAGLPVLFAGELTVAEGIVASYTPESGSYRTPACQRQVAEQHPLLRQAALHGGSWES